MPDDAFEFFVTFVTFDTFVTFVICYGGSAMGTPIVKTKFLAFSSLLAGILGFATTQSLANDRLVILSPHRKSIQNEFLPAFKEHYKKTYNQEVDVDWLDQGGTSDDIRFLRAKFDSKTKTAGIDIFWGGGASAFTELSRDKLLAPVQLPADLSRQLPNSIAGVALRDSPSSSTPSTPSTWYGSALSSFGIFYNKKVGLLEKLPPPVEWSDLSKPVYKDQLVLADPRRSGSAGTLNAIILQKAGWTKGWEQLTLIAANTKTFTHSSSDPIKAVVSGEAALSLAIDFYATPKVAELGDQNLSFTLPPEMFVLDPDPVGMIEGAPNRKVAERFIQWVLSVPAQKLLILPKGQPDGPKLESLGRMAVTPLAYQETEGRRIQSFDPFKAQSVFKFDTEKAAKTQRVFNDLLGAVLIDTHPQLKAAWASVIKRGAKPEDLANLAAMPLSEADLMSLASQWDNGIFRNETINKWVGFAKEKYTKLAKNP